MAAKTGVSRPILQPFSVPQHLFFLCDAWKLVLPSRGRPRSPLRNACGGIAAVASRTWRSVDWMDIRWSNLGGTGILTQQKTSNQGPCPISTRTKRSYFLLIIARALERHFLVFCALRVVCFRPLTLKSTPTRFSTRKFGTR